MADNTQINPIPPGEIISTESLGNVGDSGEEVKMERAKIAIGTKGLDGGDVSFVNPLPIRPTSFVQGGRLMRPFFDDKVGIPIIVSAFNTNGGSIWIQGKRTLKRIVVMKASTGNVILNVYNDYYVSGGGQLLIPLDTSRVDTYEFNIPFTTGIYYKMPDPGGGATPPTVMFVVS